MIERRKEQRWPAYLCGVITFNRGQWTADCLVRNTSPCGARLQLKESVLLPDEFSVRIPNKQKEMRVSIRWRQFREVGVETVPERCAEPVDLELERQFRRLDQHNAELKRQLSDLADPPL